MQCPKGPTLHIHTYIRTYPPLLFLEVTQGAKLNIFIMFYCFLRLNKTAYKIRNSTDIKVKDILNSAGNSVKYCLVKFILDEHIFMK